MVINLVVAVTDSDWFNFLSGRRDLTEVNFWAPSAVRFRALQPGELFLFKLHAPRNVIVGGGVFAYANSLPLSLAWEAFRDANGAGSLEEMRRRIARYRRVVANPRDEFEIGCRVLTEPFFFPESEWIPAPADWAMNIVSFKRYNGEEKYGRQLWDAVSETLSRSRASFLREEPARYGTPRLIQPRLGQGAFRVVVTDSYERRCAVTRESTLPALEAAHIRPYAEGGAHAPENGLLLRRDLHSLLDAGYVTVTPDLKFEVSRKIREEFDNGREYYALHGSAISVPKNLTQRPDVEALRWHNEHVYRG